MIRFFFIFVGFICFSQSFGQTEKSNSISQDQLLSVKSVLESHFSGTNIRDVRGDFRISRDTLSHHYVFTGKAREFLLPAHLDILQQKLNEVLQRYKGTELVGTVFFDTYSDSALVHVYEFAMDDMIFLTEPVILQPRDGISLFSRRLHDYLKIKINQHDIPTDEICSKEYLRLIVTREGTIFWDESGDMQGVLDSFLTTEERWNPGIMSGRPVSARIDVTVFPDYINGQSLWPNEAAWSVPHVFTSADVGEQDTFYSYEKTHLYQDYAIVSLVFDSMLKKYRLPFVHSGGLDKCSKLIHDILGAGKPLAYEHDGLRRVYFYRK